MQSKPYLPNLDRSTYELVLAEAQYVRGQLIKPKQVVMPRFGGDDRSSMSIESFVNVLDRSDSLECIAEETPHPDGIVVVMTNINNNKKAILTLRYSGKDCTPKDYIASITLGVHKQVSFKGGVKKAVEIVEDYLLNRRKETTKRYSPDGSEGEYAHLEEQFRIS